MRCLWLAAPSMQCGSRCTTGTPRVKRYPSSESSWGLKNVKEDRTLGVCMCKCEKCKYRPWNVCVPGCVITSGTVTARKGHRPWRCCVEGYGWKGAGKGRPPTQRNPHLPSLVSLFQLYMLTVRVNVHITQRSIPGCQDVGVGHRGQM